MQEDSTKELRFIEARVTPKASSNRIENGETNGETMSVRVYVTTVPEDGKANKEVIKLLSKSLKIPKSSLKIIKGEKSRDKTIEIN